MATLDIVGSGPYPLVSAVVERAATLSNQLYIAAQKEIALVVAQTRSIQPLEKDNPVVEGISVFPVIPDNLDALRFDHVFAANTTARHNLEAAFDGKIAEYLNYVFPLDGGVTAAQAWLASVFNGTALDPVHEERIWGRERNRIRKEAANGIDETLALWAGRGYALPPGAAVGAVAAIQRTQLEQAAAASRDIAVKTYETEIELLKNAVDQTIRMRVEAISHMAEFIKTAAMGPLLINEIQQGTTEITAKLTEATLEYFKVENAYRSVKFEKQKEVAEFNREFNKLKFDSELERVKTQAMGVLEAAKLAGTMAAAALNGIHASAAVQGSSSDSTSTQLYA